MLQNIFRSKFKKIIFTQYFFFYFDVTKKISFNSHKNNFHSIFFIFHLILRKYFSFNNLPYGILAIVTTRLFPASSVIFAEDRRGVPNEGQKGQKQRRSLQKRPKTEKVPTKKATNALPKRPILNIDI